MGDSTSSDNSLLVRGGTIVDGTGSPRFLGDVRIKDGLIVEIGPNLQPDGETEIDAGGAFVAPGFIEGHTHFDPTLFWDPSCDPMPLHGVTTVLFGNCSLSMAPVRQGDRPLIAETFGVVEEIPDSIFADFVPWSWESYPEYVASMQSHGFAVNVAGLIGLSMLRQYVIGPEAWDRPSTEEERQTIAELLDDALRGGAAGFSTSYYDFDKDGRMVPSGLADDEELAEYLKVTGRHKGHFEVLTAMLQPSLSMVQLEKCARMSGAADVVMTFNGFSDRDRDPTFSEKYMALTRQLQAEGLPVYPTMSPHPSEFMANFQGGMGFITVPAWNELLQAGSEEAQSRLLSDPEWRARAKEDWDRVAKATFPHHDLDQVMIETVDSPDLEIFVGKRFGDWATGHGGHPSDALADWLQMNNLHPGLTYTVGNSNQERMTELLTDPLVVVSASDAGAHCVSHCNTGDSTLLLTRYVRDGGNLTLEQAIAEITSRLADVYGFADIGRLEVGKRGDLTIFDLEALKWDAPEAANNFPGGSKRYRRPAGGYRATVVNGVITQLDSEMTGNLPGQWLPGKVPVKI